MTLGEALRDDIVALEAGWIRLLPNLDSSGRHLLFIEPARHTREGYITESLVRHTIYLRAACFLLQSCSSHVCRSLA